MNINQQFQELITKIKSMPAEQLAGLGMISVGVILILIAVILIL